METKFVLPEGKADDVIDVMVCDNDYLAYQYGNDVYLSQSHEVVGCVPDCNIRMREDDSEESETDFDLNEKKIFAYIRKNIHQEPTIEEIHQHAAIIKETLSNKLADQIREFIAENVNFSRINKDREGVIVAIINRGLNHPESLKTYINQLYVKSI